MYYSSRYASPVGEIVMVSDKDNLVGLWFSGEKYFCSTIDGDIIEDNDADILKAGRAWLDSYFAGKAPSPSGLPLAPAGSDFRQNVWRLLMEIPYGQVTTYGDIAKEMAKRMGKKSMSAQAVGGAVGHNPISILIPCHRVIGSSGSLTGYAGGIHKKLELLKLEGVDLTGMFVPKTGTAL